MYSWPTIPTNRKGNANMRTNRKTTTPAPRTAPGAIASRITPELQLRRSVLANMLWEGLFYEDGVAVTDRIKELVPQVPAEKVAALAVEARNKQKLRDVPLFLTREMFRHKEYTQAAAGALTEVIQRPDQMCEFVSLYWKDKKQPLANQAKKALARAFQKFNGYQLGKYNQDRDIKLRDVLFLCHPKPKDKDQEALWKKLVDGTLETPDTWEVELSAGKGENKKESWTRMLQENKLGVLALLRNLRNMTQAGVDDNLIRKALKECNPERALPFRFITAARYAPKFEPELEALMFKCLAGREKLKGKTVLVIDVSGSMGGVVSSKSEISRMDAAIALAMLVRELSEEVVIYATAGNDCSRRHSTKMVRARRGFALRDEITKMVSELGGGGIFLKQCMDYIYPLEKSAQRVIVCSDSQDCSVEDYDRPSKALAFGDNNYLMDISCEKNGIGYNKFMVINGFSEALVDYVVEFEKMFSTSMFQKV